MQTEYNSWASFFYFFTLQYMEPLFSSALVTVSVVSLWIFLSAIYVFRNRHIAKEIRKKLETELKEKTDNSLRDIQKQKVDFEKRYNQLTQELKDKIAETEKVRGELESMKQKFFESWAAQAIVELLSELWKFISKNYQSEQNKQKYFALVNHFKTYLLEKAKKAEAKK